VAERIDMPDTELLDGLTAIASRAAAAILAIRSGDLATSHKADHSPVTAADTAAEAEILEGLGRLLPGVPVVSEESTSRPSPAELTGTFILVDPLDGTREFIKGLDEYVVNIAIVRGGTPTAGVIAAPARGRVWRGAVGGGAERLVLAPGSEPQAARERVAIHTRRCPDRGAQVVTSRSHMDSATAAYVARLPAAQPMPCGSALKFCLVADGTADLYPRLAPTSEWDIAAGHALVAAAGGVMVRPDGSPLVYGRGEILVPGFLAVGDKSRLVTV